MPEGMVEVFNALRFIRGEILWVDVTPQQEYK